MSRGPMARRKGGRASEPTEVWQLSTDLLDESDRRAERLDAENATLRDRVDEVEAWYRLLVDEHAGLQRKHEQVGRKVGELQAEKDRLESKIHEIEADVDRAQVPGRSAGPRKDPTKMIRNAKWFQFASRHRWSTALAIALAAMVARDPGVQEVYSAAMARVRSGPGATDPDVAGAGYVRYAAMILARDEAERARAEYNTLESSLKGDALLESQDRLRAAKSRYRTARLAFLPELARRCEQARLPVPREAAEALAVLRQELGE